MARPFWSKHPVPSPLSTAPATFQAPRELDPPCVEPAALPAGLAWATIDVKSDEGLAELQRFLLANYVASARSKYAYTLSALAWALRALPPELMVGVRSEASAGALVACITAAPLMLRIDGKIHESASIDFLCVGEEMRGKGLAPALIAEIIRRFRRRRPSVVTAIYTVSIEIPQNNIARPAAIARFSHRFLQPRHLRFAGFAPPLQPPMTPSREARLLHLPLQPVHNLRQPVDGDAEALATLLNSTAHLISRIWTADEVRHEILPCSGVLDSLVRVDKQGVIQELVSWTYVHHEWNVPGLVRAVPIVSALQWYTVASNSGLKELLPHAMAAASAGGAHLWTAHDAGVPPRHANGTGMGNVNAIGDVDGWRSAHRFVPGSGGLAYHIYNCNYPVIDASDIQVQLY